MKYPKPFTRIGPTPEIHSDHSVHWAYLVWNIYLKHVIINGQFIRDQWSSNILEWAWLKWKRVMDLKCILFYFDMLITFCFGVSSNLSQEKSPTAEILGKYFLRTIVPRKYLPKISTVGLFCCDKFEETPKQKVINMSKLNKLHFRLIDNFGNIWGL